MARSAAETRKRVLMSAADCFERYGFRKTTVDDIARAAQVGKGTVYLHFTDKDGVLTAVMEALSADLAAAAVAGTDPTRHTLSNLLLMLRNMIEFLRANPLLASITRDPVAFGAPSLGPLLAEQQQRGMAILEQVIRDGIARGDIVPVDVEVAVSVLVGAYQGFFFGQPGEAGFDRAAAFVDFIDRLLYRGIDARPQNNAARKEPDLGGDASC